MASSHGEECRAPFCTTPLRGNGRNAVSRLLWLQSSYSPHPHVRKVPFDKDIGQFCMGSTASTPQDF